VEWQKKEDTEEEIVYIYIYMRSMNIYIYIYRETSRRRVHIYTHVYMCICIHICIYTVKIRGGKNERGRGVCIVEKLSGEIKMKSGILENSSCLKGQKDEGFFLRNSCHLTYGYTA